MGIKFKLFFAWYDFWIGFYWDREKRVLHICPVPTVVIKIWKPQPVKFQKVEMKGIRHYIHEVIDPVGPPFNREVSEKFAAQLVRHSIDFETQQNHEFMYGSQKDAGRNTD
jgi:predicted GNAT family acetyltransferase